jgi:aminoglycoside phosphotransferase (APT) family kinase protein
MIPENKQFTVRTALQKAFNTERFDNIVQLTKGLSGALVFKITVNGTHYLLRIVISETRDKPEYYFDCLSAAANAGLAPAIHYLNVEDKVSITDYIEDRYFPVDEARIKMADTLRVLHALPKFSCRLNYIEASDMFLQKFLSSGIMRGSEIQDVLALYARIKNVYPRNDPHNLVSCHNDVKRDNIIYDGLRPWLVDWEAARLNDRYVDLAAIANFVIKDEKDETDFLKRYFGEASDEYNQARFFLMSQIVHMFCFTLCAVPGSGGKSINIKMNTLGFNEFHDRLWNGEINLGNNDEKLHYGLVHLKKLQNDMQTKRFDESLRVVGDHNSVG